MNQQKFMAAVTPFLVIEVGGKSKGELLGKIRGVGMVVSGPAEEIASKEAWKPGKREVVRFAKAKVRDFGFSKHPTRSELFARIEEFGCLLCEPADGPALRIAIKDQLPGSVFWIAMKQIMAFGQYPSAFKLGNRNGKMWLDASLATISDGRWLLHDEVVFRLPS